MDSRRRPSKQNYSDDASFFPSKLTTFLLIVTCLSAIATIVMVILSPIYLNNISSRLSKAEDALGAVVPAVSSPFCASGCGAVFTTCESDGDCTGLAAVTGMTLTSTCALDVGICLGTIEFTSVGPQPGELGDVLCQAALNTTVNGCFTVVPHVVGGQVEECKVFNGCATPTWPTVI